MSAPSIPTNYNINTNVNGTLNTNLNGTMNTNVNGTMNTNLNGSLTTKMIGDPNQPLATLLIGDPGRPVATDMKMELLNLPRFTLKDIKDFMKMRIRMPDYSQVCFKLFGQEVFSICMSGERQVITEPYVPNAYERCEVDCCEPDTRPFPEPHDRPQITVAAPKAASGKK